MKEIMSFPHSSGDGGRGALVGKLGMGVTPEGRDPRGTEWEKVDEGVW